MIEGEGEEGRDKSSRRWAAAEQPAAADEEGDEGEQEEEEGEAEEWFAGRGELELRC